MKYQTLHRLFRCSKEFSHKKIRTQDMSDTECMICSYVYSHEACSQDEVASALKTDKTTVGKALASLEKKQCVTRTQDAADRRIKRLALTDTGRAKVADLTDLHNHWLARIMACLNEDEQRQFEDICDRLLAEAEKLNKINGGERE